jgi:RimJ/RimL family protein N-acetyltransferase
VRTVTTENQRYLGEWLVRVLNFPLPQTTQCIGQLKDGNLVAVAGYTNFMPKACEIHIGSVGEHWASKDFIWAVFDYPFNKLGLSVILGQICADNIDALKLNRHLGFKVVAEIPDAHMSGDLVIMAMRKEECRFLNIRCSLNKGE